MDNGLGVKQDNGQGSLGAKEEFGSGAIGSKDFNQNAFVSKEAYVSPEERKGGPYGELEYLKNYSDNNTAVYLDKKDKEIKIGMRGSTTKLDWLQNLNILRGSYYMDSDFRKDNRLVNQLKKDYEGYSISTTGHSRGGSRARQVAYRNDNIKATTFNAGAGAGITDNLINARCALGSTSKNCKNITNYRTEGDVVSAGSKINSITIKPKVGKDARSAHKIDNFLFI